jgi:hypothetical protein
LIPFPGLRRGFLPLLLKEAVPFLSPFLPKLLLIPGKSGAHSFVRSLSNPLRPFPPSVPLRAPSRPFLLGKLRVARSQPLCPKIPQRATFLPARAACPLRGGLDPSD